MRPPSDLIGPGTDTREALFDRDLAIGFVVALALHAAIGGGGLAMISRHSPLPPLERKLVRSVREKVALPKPEPKPEPKPQPKIETKPDPKPEEKVEAPTPVAKPARRPRPKRDSARKKPPPQTPQPKSNEPPPLVLSQTYGAGGDGGVYVESGDEDYLGDANVEPTAANMRDREDAETSVVDKPADVAPQTAREVVIKHATPTAPCEVEWPEGVPAGRRIVEVRLLLTISRNGAVQKAQVLRSAGSPFDEVAVAALKRCGFRPGRRDGKVFVDRVPFVVEFKPGAG